MRASGIAKMIRFRELRVSDVDLLHQWLNADEVLRWYGHGQPRSRECVRTKYFDSASPLTHRHIAVDGEESIGYLHWYRVADYPEYARQIGALPGDYGLDLFIGRDQSVGKGFGRQIVQLALSELIFSNPDAMRCVLGPVPENQRAIRCYEACGFRHLRTVQTEEGTEYIMAIPRIRTDSQQGDPKDAVAWSH
jgi:RimJ/RimL family protein N-acetyltransferase